MAEWKCTVYYEVADEYHIITREFPIWEESYDELTELVEDHVDINDPDLMELSCDLYDAITEDLCLDEEENYNLYGVIPWDPGFLPRLRDRFVGMHIKESVLERMMRGENGVVFLTEGSEILHIETGRGMHLEAICTLPITIAENGEIVDFDEPVVDLQEYGKPRNDEFVPLYVELEETLEEIVEEDVEE